MNASKAIKTIRGVLGINQKDFAKLIGTTQSHICNIELGKTKISSNMIIRISEKLGVAKEVIMWYGLDDEDVEDSKREAFNIIKPSIDALLKALF